MATFNTPNATYTTSPGMPPNSHCPRCEQPISVHSNTTWVRNGKLGSTRYGTDCPRVGRATQPVRSAYSGPICARCKRAISKGETILFWPVEHYDCRNVYRHSNNAPEQETSPDVPAPTPQPTNTQPAPTPAPTAPAPDIDTLAAVVNAVNTTVIPRVNTELQKRDERLDSLETRVNANHSNVMTRIGEIERIVADTRPTQITYVAPNTTVTSEMPASRHKAFDALLDLALSLDVNERNIWLAGPAGSGKTHSAKMLAATLNLPYYECGSLTAAFELMGFVDANGRYVDTPLYHAWKDGGVFMFDEISGSMPAAVLRFNSMLANGSFTFPNDPRPLPRHENCLLMAGDNTWGRGDTTGQYGARSKMDDATLDRFAKIDWQYDTKLEFNIARSYATPTTQAIIDAYTQAIIDCRKLGIDNKAKILFSTRAIKRGAQLLRNRIAPQDVISTSFADMQSLDKWAVVAAPLNSWQATYSGYGRRLGDIATQSEAN